MAQADISSLEASGNIVSENAYVYAISAGAEVIKIGRARNAVSRLKELQTSHHQPLVLLYSLECVARQASAVEREAHHLLRKHRLEGEWFQVSGDLAQQAICQAQDIVRISENIGEAGKTPRTDAAEKVARQLSDAAREDCAWKTARQFECELRELQRKLREQAA